MEMPGDHRRRYVRKEDSSEMLYRYIQLSGGQLTEGWRSTGYYYYSDKSPRYYMCFPPEGFKAADGSSLAQYKSFASVARAHGLEPCFLHVRYMVQESQEAARMKLEPGFHAEGAQADSDQESEDNGERPSDCLPDNQVPDYPGKRPLTNPPKRMRNLTQMARELPCKKLCTAKNVKTAADQAPAENTAEASMEPTEVKDAAEGCLVEEQELDGQAGNHTGQIAEENPNASMQDAPVNASEYDVEGCNEGQSPVRGQAPKRTGQGVAENADASMHDALNEQAAAEQAAATAAAAAAAGEDGYGIAAMDPGAAGECEMQAQLGSGYALGDEEISDMTMQHPDQQMICEGTMKQSEQQKLPAMAMQGADQKGEETGDSGLVYGCGLASMLEDDVNSMSVDTLPLAARMAALRQTRGAEQLLLGGFDSTSKAENGDLMDQEAGDENVDKPSGPLLLEASQADSKEAERDLIAELFGTDDDEDVGAAREGSPQETQTAARHVPPCDGMCHPGRQLSGEPMETDTIGFPATDTQKSAAPKEQLQTEKSLSHGILKQRMTSDETSGEAGMHAAKGQLEGAKTTDKGKPLQGKESQTHARKRKAAAEPSKEAQMRAEMHAAQGQPVAAVACQKKPLQTETLSDGQQLKTADGINREAERQAARGQRGAAKTAHTGNSGQAEKAQLNARMHKTAESAGGKEEMHAARSQHADAKTADKGKAGHDRDDSSSKDDSGISAVVHQIADEAAAMELHAAAGMDTCNSEKLPHKFFGVQGGSKARLALAGECCRKEAPDSKGLASVAAIDRKKAPSNKSLASAAAIDMQKSPGNKSLALAAADDRKKAPVNTGLAPASGNARKEAANKQGRASAAGNSREAAASGWGLSDEVIDYIRELQANNQHLRAEKAQLQRKCDTIKQILERWNGHFAELAALLSIGASSAW